MGPLHILDLGSPDNLLNANLTHYPPTPPSQVTANLAARVVLGLAANAAMAVPLRILYRHGEFAAAVFITTTMILNGFTIVHALVWRDDDTSAWWLGEGYCDAFPYVYFPLMMVYDTSIFAIMRHLAQQISLVRADAPTPRELRRRSIVQALVIFPLPLVQLAWMYPLTEHRYGLMTLSGCRWLPVDAWPLTVFFILMYPLYALGALYYAIVVWYRYRQIAATATAILATSNSAASNRARRARRRLYFMTLSILTPYFPVCALFAVHNMLNYGSFAPLDVPALRAGRFDGIPWNTIFLTPTSSMDFGSLVDRYIAIITAFPVFLFFGLTKDAINTYRRAALVLGLGRPFPCLREEYDPDRRDFPSHGGPSTSSHILATSETTQSYSKHPPRLTNAPAGDEPRSAHAHAPAPPPSSPLASVLRSAFHRKGATYPVRTEAETEASPVAPAAGNAVPCPYLPQIPIGVVETRVWSTEDDASHAKRLGGGEP